MIGTDYVSRPVAGEAAMLVEWDRVIARKARQVYYPRRVGKDHADVEQDLRIALIQLWRRHHHVHDRPPDPALVRCAINRAQMNSVRATLGKSATLVIFGDSATEAGTVDDKACAFVDPVEAETQHEVHLTVVDVLRRELSPRSYALLDLRCSQDMRGTEIGAAVGLTSREVACELRAAKLQAAAVLRELGVTTITDLEDVHPEEISHD